MINRVIIGKLNILLSLSLLGIMMNSSIAVAELALNCEIVAEPRSGRAVLPVEFDLSIQGGVAPYTCSWDFDDRDGIQVDKYHQDPTFAFGYSGKYVITAAVTDRNGLTAVDTIHISVLPGDFTPSEPIEIYNVDHSASEPYIIEGLEITNPDGCGIRMEFCNNVIIRNCWFHDITSPNALEEGMLDAILIAKSSNVLVENCLFTNNARGILSNAWGDYLYNYNITVRNCVLENCRYSHGIHLKNTDGIEVSNNVLRNNGDPDYFQHHRITGIICWASHNISMHDNFVINSSSDGIGVAADNMLINGENPDFVSENFKVFRNTVRKNGEMGLWFTVATNGEVYDNYIENNRLNGINFEFKVSNSSIHNNFMKDDSVSGIMINNSFDNMICGNTITEPISGLGAIWVHNMHQLQIHGDYAVRTNRNFFRNNVIYNSLHGIRVSDGDSTHIFNNTIYSSGPYYRNGEAGITVDSLAGFTVIKNNIISGNNGTGISVFNEETHVLYNDLYENLGGNYLNFDGGWNDISVDPLFENPQLHNFYLSELSPCIDAGDPMDDFSNEPQPNGERINMGAYGNTKYAAASGQVGIGLYDEKKQSFTFVGNYPNPFNSSTMIEFYLPDRRIADIKIFNINGRLVKHMPFRSAYTGKHTVTLDGSSLSSGIYYCRIQSGKENTVKKMLLLK